jgi:hypothetical protein
LTVFEEVWTREVEFVADRAEGAEFDRDEGGSCGRFQFEQFYSARVYLD